MATHQQPDQNQQSTQEGDSLSGSIQTANQAGTQGGSEQRSEGLLPTGGEDDGRFDVAEEVSLDQQSDQLRHVGQAPDSSAAASAGTVGADDDDEAADDVLPDPAKQSDG